MPISLPGRLYPSAEAGGGLEDGDGLGLRQLAQVVRRRQAADAAANHGVAHTAVEGNLGF